MYVVQDWKATSEITLSERDKRSCEQYSEQTMMAEWMADGYA